MDDLTNSLEALSKLANGEVVMRSVVIESCKVVSQAWKEKRLCIRVPKVVKPKPVLEGSPEFLAFWEKYPRKINRKLAMKAWTAANPGQDLVATIMQALERHCGKWAGKDETFIPHASSWLNGERWVDELPVTKQVDMSADPIYKNWPYSKPTNRPETTQEYRTRMDAMRRV